MDAALLESKMNIGDDVVKISDVPPLALLDLVGKIMTAKKLHPERLRELYPRYCSVLKQIRQEKNLSIEELFALSGSSSDFLQAAESLEVEMTDDNLKTLHDVYGELATGEDHPGDFKRLANERLASESICSRSAIKASAVSPCGDDSPQSTTLPFSS